ncbi:MAG: LysR family transcriptional regulator [Sandaracinaceae bacterium]|nr:LysR family transcriptional regulator [Sandaracinaceae bacterium]
MSEPQPSWELYETFLEVIRGGSLSAASRSLGVAQPTVRRRVEALEAALGAVLFTRAPNGLTPTPAAEAMRPLAETMAASAGALVRSASAPMTASAGTVRLAASEIVGVEVLPPILARLRARHPAIAIELVLSNRNEDLLRRDADVAVRMVAPTQAALVARRAGEVEVGLYASEAYLASRRAPRRAAELPRHALVGDDRARSLREGLAAVGIALSPRDFALRTDSHLAQLAAVRAGVGIGPCQRPLAERDGLLRVLPSLAFPLGIWIVTHEELRPVQRVRAVFDHLVEALAAYASSRPMRREA